MWEHEPKATTENIEVPLTYDLMIPSSGNTENKALQLDIILRYKKREEGIANLGVNSSDFGLNDAEIKKMTKHQDLENEVRRSWKLENAKVDPVIAGPTGMMTKNLTEIFNIGAVPLGTHLVVAG